VSKILRSLHARLNAVPTDLELYGKTRLLNGENGFCSRLTASMRVIKAHEGGRVTIAWAKRRVAEAAAARDAKSADKDLLLLAAKLERACGCSIDELAKIAEKWA